MSQRIISVSHHVILDKAVDYLIWGGGAFLTIDRQLTYRDHNGVQMCVTGLMSGMMATGKQLSLGSRNT